LSNDTIEVDLSIEERQSSQEAFEKLLPLMQAIPADKVRQPRTDVVQAAIAALGVAAKVNEPDWRSVYARLPAESFDITTLDRLALAARAAIFAFAEASTAEAIASGAKLPEQVVSEATELRERMLRVYEYHLGQNPVEAAKIADIRAGKGYADLAVDLQRLAGTYRQNLAVFSRDPTHFVSEDPSRAEAVAEQIQKLLGAETSPKQKTKKELEARAWSFLNDTYEQIAKPGRWLFDGRGAECFVSLVGAGRKNRRKEKKQEAATPPANVS
jgi:hypothetical protein